MTPSHQKRPINIGLALGSGVARGWAHIGIVKRLVREGFAPDIVVGTSIGAVVGAAYANNGISEIENFAKTLSKRRIFSFLDLRFGSPGLISGRKLAKELYHFLGGIQIEDLPKKLVVVTTELSTGHEIWLREGSLIDALRASYALPGIFAPVHIDGRWLIDGALVNPVPASVCRAFGARLVIAVNLNRDAFGKASTSKFIIKDDALSIEQELMQDKSKNKIPARNLIKKLFSSGEKTPGMTAVMLAAINIMQDRLSRSRLAGDPPDIHITPKVGHISLLDFSRAEEAIKLGEQAVENNLPALHQAREILL